VIQSHSGEGGGLVQRDWVRGKAGTLDSVRFQARYQRGEWRTLVFRDMVLDDIRSCSRPPVVVDVGCGKGFDGSPEIQEGLAAASARYIGVEPDNTVVPPRHIHQFHSCLFENADIEPESVDVAFSVMVLEHVEKPVEFWAKVSAILRPGGVFWGFTVDRRHPFCHASQLAESLRIKDHLLTWLRGSRGVDRYENFPTFYRMNSPRQIRANGPPAGTFDFVNLSVVGQLDFYVPRRLRPLSHACDRLSIALGLPGHLLAMRWQKPAGTVNGGA
jgi:SAM-dependent methyltransferase